MLQTLTIENIAIIKQAQLELEPGFIALTGETGAGKSILIDAINAVLGERTSRDLIRTGATTARVAAAFHIHSPQVSALLQSFDLPQEDDHTLLLQRSLSVAGGSRCRVNGTPVTVTQLRQLGQLLLNIHGQHDNQSLLDAKQHLHFIDAMVENAALRTQYRAAWQRLRRMQTELETLQQTETTRATKLETLTEQIAALQTLQPQPGEPSKLRARHEVIQNNAAIAESLQNAETSLLGDDETPGAAQLAFRAVASLEKALAFLPATEPLCTAIRNAAYEIEEGCSELRQLAESTLFDPQEADALQQRLDLYYRLSRKYNSPEDSLATLLPQAQSEFEQLSQNDERLAACTAQIATQRETTIALAKQLTRSRKEAATQFAAQVRAELEELDMQGVRFDVQFTKVPLRLEGGEEAEFLLAANAGATPKPLAKIASGGELSRVMLAIKAVLAAKDETPTLIFDEIDTGVSGRAAHKIGAKLRQVAAGRQVLCVTHLAQIACQADVHLHISKAIHQNETQTQIARLGAEERKHELARIIGGEQITETGLAAAEEMLRRT